MDGNGAELLSLVTLHMHRVFVVRTMSIQDIPLHTTYYPPWKLQA